MKALRNILVASAALAMVAGMAGCKKYEKSANSHTSGTMTMVCDNTFENIMRQEVDVFEYQYPDAHILTLYGPQREALDSLLYGNQTKAIVIQRDLTDQERAVLKSRRRTPRSMKIAVDAVALIVNKDNPVDKLTLSEVADILSGSSSEWNDLQPCKLGKINVVFDDKGSSLVTYMRDSLLNGGELGPNVSQTGSIPGVFKAVETNRNAIGILGVSWITTDMASADMSRDELAQSVLGDEPIQGATLDDKIKVVKIARNDEATFYRPYQQNIFDGTYPLFRQMYMITTGASGSLANGFYSFVTGDIGQKIIMKTGILPARTRIQVVQLGEN